MKQKFAQLKNIILVVWRRHHFIVPPRYWKKYFKSFIRKITNKKEYLNPFITEEYNLWLKNKKSDTNYKNKFKYNPLISFIIPVYNIEPEYLRDCIDSILNQKYTNFEICIADDCSTKKETIEELKKYEEKDKRIKVIYRETNGHISAATNSALEITSGEYIALMDDDDIITEDALYKIVEILNKDKTIDMIYSDEDKMDMEGNYCEPHFKPDFAIDSFYGGNFICHFTVIKKELFNKIGKFNQEFVGAQDFDLFLRATENANKVYHIPEILYHWRKVPGSTADTIENKEYAIENGKKAVEAALKRRNKDGYVTVPIKCTQYIVHYNYDKEPLVSVIMIDCNEKSIKNNLKEINKRTKYNNLEIIINYNKKIDKDIIKSNVKVISENNINKLIKKAKGEHILIISGKIKVDNNNWISELVGYSIQEEIGVVAPRIHNFDKLIKSAGLILSNEHIFENAFRNYFVDSVGVYGRLLVPYNYSALSSICFMFKKNKYNKVNGFLENVCLDISNIDFCLKLLNNNCRNVLLPHISIRQKNIHKDAYYKISEKDKNKLRELWNLDNDIYYNRNNSKKYPFMLEVSDHETKNN